MKPMPYKEPVVDLNSRRDTAAKVDQMKDIIKQLVFHIDPELKPKPKEEEDAKKECTGVIGHTVATMFGGKHGCEEPEPPKDQAPEDK